MFDGGYYRQAAPDGAKNVSRLARFRRPVRTLFTPVIERGNGVNKESNGGGDKGNEKSEAMDEQGPTRVIPKKTHHASKS